MKRKKLPIGIQTFAKLREGDCYYVDKTPLALKLIEEGSVYFLSRPRRFGKSLFLDTLKELFEGNQALFKGLYAEDHWDWSVTYPVIRLSFGGGVLKTPQALEAVIHEQLSGYEERYALPVTASGFSSRFRRLIVNLHAHANQRVVVLIDEYDKPILDNLTEPELARTMRDTLYDIYSVFKENGAHLKFVFITGVSKFSRASQFSALNHINDITLMADYSSLCGYTENDLKTVFAPELEGVDWAQIQARYNGYNWLGEAVYNPFDLLLFFREKSFKPYWFETGTPTFLAEFLSQHHYFTPDLSQIYSNDSLLSSFDVDYIGPEALLWQTGCLTFHDVKRMHSGQLMYVLGYPNREVEAALNDALLSGYGLDPQQTLIARSQLDAAFAAYDLEALQNSLHALFASIAPLSSAIMRDDSPTAEASHDWHRNAPSVGECASRTDGDSSDNPLIQYEGYYASIFYSQLAALGLNVRVEDSANKGQIDLALRYQDHVYLLEFKVIEQVPEGKALQQLIDKGYAEKYREPGIGITLIGIEFSREQRNIVAFDTHTVDI